MSTIERAIDKLGFAAGKESPAEQSAEASSEGLNAEHVAVVDAASSRKKEVQSPGVDRQAREGSRSRININLEKLKKAGIVTPDAKRSQIAEEIRHIKRPLLLNAFGEGALQTANRNLVMVTSARPSEGKTFTAINLAMSIVLERDRTVLLVDADVARPSVAKVFDIPDTTTGLVDYLADHDRQLSDLILQTDLPKLRLLPAGRRHVHSTELLASETMIKLVKELSDRYPDRIVLFDSPPLLATSEAAVLAGLMGQVVMVVEAAKTKREELTEALTLLDANQYVGLVLNKSSKPFGADYYYSGYQAYGE
jgi:receptor protein-tyrosine kinase